MALKRATISVTKNYELEYDDVSPEFKEALHYYRRNISAIGSKTDMLEQIAFHVDQYGVNSIVDGIGFVKKNGEFKGEPYCGVNVIEHFQPPYTTLEDIDEIKPKKNAKKI